MSASIGNIKKQIIQSFNNDLLISDASKLLTKHDISKRVTEKELLAVHWGINFFRPYLYSRKFIGVTGRRFSLKLT